MSFKCCGTKLHGKRLTDLVFSLVLSLPERMAFGTKVFALQGNSFEGATVQYQAGGKDKNDLFVCIQDPRLRP